MELKVGDIIDNNTERLICLKIDTLGKIFFNIYTKEIIIYQDDYIDENKFKYHGNVSTLLDNRVKTYVWLGMEWKQIKLLVNLKSLTVEIFHCRNLYWEDLDEDNIKVEDNIMYIFLLGVTFEIDLDTLKIRYLQTKGLKFRPFNNFILGKEDEYVFNSNNEMELSTN